MAGEDSAGMRSAKRWSAYAAAVVIAVAVGAVGYHVATNLINLWARNSIRSAIPPMMLNGSVESTSPTATSPLGFDLVGWEMEDQAYWRSLKEGRPFGRLVIRSIRVDDIVVKGTSKSDLMRGPGWVYRTALPGRIGNCGISGHRTTYGAPFFRLDRLRKGATITFYSPFREYTYKVSRVFVVRPTQVEVLAPSQTPLLTLTTCNPPYSARQRLIVQSRLVAVRALRKR